jgi:ATP-dependent Lon protease
MDAEIDVFQVEKRIRGRVKKQMEKSQREYYLNEQMKAIQKELGEMDDAPNEIDDLQNKINEARMSDEAFEKANAELSKLKMMSPMSAEASNEHRVCWIRITSGWKKSKSGSSNIWPCKSGSAN